MMITTLEQIMGRGTEAEKELAQLSQSMPTNAEEMFQNDVKEYAWGTLGFGLGAVGLVSYGVVEQVQDTFSLFWGGVGVLITGVGTLVNGFSLNEYLKIKSEYTHKEQWDRILPQTDRPLFYHFNDGFTYNPTPIEVRLGQRVYPIETLEEIDEIKERAMVYVSDVLVREVSRENYEGFVEKGMTDRGAEFEKVFQAKVQYELRKQEEADYVEMNLILDNNKKHYFDTFSQESKGCSLLLSIQKGKIEYISRIFPYQKRD